MRICHTDRQHTYLCCKADQDPSSCSPCLSNDGEDAACEDTDPNPQAPEHLSMVNNLTNDNAKKKIVHDGTNLRRVLGAAVVETAWTEKHI